MLTALRQRLKPDIFMRVNAGLKACSTQKKELLCQLIAAL